MVKILYTKLINVKDCYTIKKSRSYDFHFCSSGVHTYQRMYGCDWHDQTGDSEGFDQHGYDGQDYISLDLKELRYISPVQQGFITVVKWNNNTAQLEFLKQYYQRDCVNWLKYFLTLRKEDFKRRGRLSLTNVLCSTR